MRSGWVRTLMLAAVLASAGCTVGPDYHTPQQSLPPQYTASPAQGEAVDAATPWWHGFEDPTLNALIEQARAQNLDVSQALARLRAARAEARAAGAAELPALGLQGSATRSRNTANGLIPIGEIPNAHLINSIYDAGFDASWELDVFGGTRRAVEAAEAQTAAAADQARGALLSVTAEIAADYFDLRSAQWQAQLLDARIATAQQQLTLMQQRQQVGDVTDSEVLSLQASLAALQTQRPALETSLQAQIHQIDTLLAQPAGSSAARLLQAPAAPTLVSVAAADAALPPPPIAMPSTLLEQRPDIAAADAQLHAATAQVGVAVANEYPRFSIAGDIGNQSTGRHDFIASASNYWALGPSVSLPIFEGGALRATADARRAEAEADVAAYRQTVLAAFADAQSAFVRDAQARARLEAGARQLAAAQGLLIRAQQRVEVGDANQAELLSARDQRDQAQAAELSAWNESLRSRVALFKALGGGWSSGGDPALRAADAAH